MQKYVKVRSTATEVKLLEIDEYHVTVNNGITEIHEEAIGEDLGSGFNGWEIEEQLVYEKDEYIVFIAEQNRSLEQESTNLQIALTEVYEQILTA